MKNILITIALWILTTAAYGQDKTIPLYPNEVPNAKPIPTDYVEKISGSWVTGVSQPTLTPFFPDKRNNNGTAVIVCPGGAYAGLSFAAEGSDVCVEFNKIGVTAFLLKYRLPSDQIMLDKSIAPLQDAQMAIYTVRKNAALWGINPAKIGILGFSAGGHLASSVGTHFNKAFIKIDQKISLRPDFMLLIYPVISFGNFTHQGSRENLLGKNPQQEQLDMFSNEMQITADTPPTFLIHAGDDSAVPVQNSLLFYEGLLKYNVKAEMHIFEKGGHGFGLHNPKSNNQWFSWAGSWLRDNGF